MSSLPVKILFSTKFLNLVQTEFVVKGKTYSWFYVTRNKVTANPHAVTIVGVKKINNQPHILITEEYRAPIDSTEIGFPAGLVENGEDPVQAAIRELKEETGYEVLRVLDQSPNSLYNSAGLTDESIKFVFVELGNKTKTALEGPEQIQSSLINAETAKSLIRQKASFGAKAWVVLWCFAHNPNCFNL